MFPYKPGLDWLICDVRIPLLAGHKTCLFLRLRVRTLMSPPSLPFIASPHLWTLAPAIEAQLVHPGTP